MLCFQLQSKAAQAFPTDCAIISNTILNDSAILKLQQQMNQLKSNNICFENIPGGMVNLYSEFRKIVISKKIHIKGYCNSLCSDLAIFGSELYLYKSDNIKSPTHLLIHGSFDQKNGAWHSSSLDYVDYYIDRFPRIKKKDLIEAMSYKNYGLNGIIISATPLPHLDFKKSQVVICENYPQKCRSLNIDNLELLNIKVVD